MATMHVMTAALLPTSPIIKELSSDTYHHSPPTTSADFPQETSNDHVQSLNQSPNAEKMVDEPCLEQREATSSQTHSDFTGEASREPSQQTSIERISILSQQPPSKSENPILSVRGNMPAPEPIAFDPAKHIKYAPPSRVWTMQELGYTEGQGISPVGVSEPFPLFSEEAVNQMRAEILSEKVWDKYKYSSNLSQCQLRGYAPECAPFIYDAWKSPEVLEIVSKIAGIDLVPVMDWEIAHINIAVKSEEEKSKELEILQRNADEGVADCALEEDNHPVVDWHTDSYPFVCVTMLSDCSTMVGGETMLRKGKGGTVKVRGPQMGSAVILQGRYIEHQALRALGAAERITSVTSFRPRSAAVKDDTVLTTVRGISDLKELYHQYAEYRFEILQDRLQEMGRKLRDRKRASRPFDTAATKNFVREQIEFLEAMDRELVKDDMVQMGYIGDSHLVSEETRQTAKKRGLYATKTGVA